MLISFGDISDSRWKGLQVCISWFFNDVNLNGPFHYTDCWFRYRLFISKDNLVIWLVSGFCTMVTLSGQVVSSFLAIPCYIWISLNRYIYVLHIFICQGWNVIDNLLNPEQISTLLWPDSPCNISCLPSCMQLYM